MVSQFFDQNSHRSGENSWVPFSQVAKAFGEPKTTALTFSDASGEKSPFNLKTWGMGGLGYEFAKFRTHLRRRGGASDLFDAGCSIRDIKVVGHWSFGVLDAYLSWSQSEISNLQLAGLNRAELRAKNQWPPKIIVVRYTSLRYCFNFVFFYSSHKTN